MPSIGCIAIEDEPIEVVYLVPSTHAASHPHRSLPSPARDEVARVTEGLPNAFFRGQLAPAYQQFERTHRPAAFSVDPRTGAYRVKPATP